MADVWRRFFRIATVLLFISIVVLVAVSASENTNPKQGSEPDTLNGTAIVLALVLIVFLILSSIGPEAKPPPIIVKTLPKGQQAQLARYAKILNMEPQNFANAYLIN